jgi:hypothetical protein
MGYFALIAQVEDFIFLDDVQFSKQSWQSRNQVAGPNGPILLSIPVARKPSFPLICEAQLAKTDLVAEMIPRIRGCLGTAPYWKLVEELLIIGFARAEAGVSALNSGLILDLCGVLGLATNFHFASQVGVAKGERALRLREFCSRFSAETYLSPVGSADYLRKGHLFAEDGVRLRFLNFSHPVYGQRWKPFNPNMSLIDSLAWEGPQTTRDLIEAGIGVPWRLEQIPSEKIL